MTTIVSIDTRNNLMRRYDTKVKHRRRPTHMGILETDGASQSQVERCVKEFWQLPPNNLAVTRRLPLLLEV